MDAANSFAVNNGNLYVALVAPAVAPGVSDNIVLALRGIYTIPDSNNGMVDVGAASWGIDNTACVKLENLGVTFNADRNRAVSNGSFEGLGVGRVNIDVTLGLQNDHIWVVKAEFIFSLVRVRSFLNHARILGVLHGLISPATVAAVIPIEETGAINQLLDREHI